MRHLTDIEVEASIDSKEIAIKLNIYKKLFTTSQSIRYCKTLKEAQELLMSIVTQCYEDYIKLEQLHIDKYGK